MATNSLPTVQVEDAEAEIDAALWSAYKYILSLSRRRLARQAAEREAAGQGEPTEIQNQTQRG